MDYRAIYARLIEKYQTQSAEGYSEKHHIQPRCLGGNDSHENIVTLPARAHFIAHVLLTKMHPGVVGLSWCAFMMASRRKFKAGSSRIYATLKEIASRDISGAMTGYVKRKTAKTAAFYESRRGVPLKESTRQKLRERMTGRVFSEETISKMSAAAKGRVMSEKTREKISIAMAGNTHRRGKPTSRDVVEMQRLQSIGRKMSAQGRANISAGKRKISDETISMVRSVAKSHPGKTQQEIALICGTSKSQVGRILRGEKYSDEAAG